MKAASGSIENTSGGFDLCYRPEAWIFVQKRRYQCPGKTHEFAKVLLTTKSFAQLLVVRSSRCREVSGSKIYTRSVSLVGRISPSRFWTLVADSESSQRLPYARACTDLKIHHLFLSTLLPSCSSPGGGGNPHHSL